MAERGAGRLTDVNVEECIEIDITRPADRKRVHLVLHTTEAIDLHHKLVNALTDWVVEAAATFRQAAAAEDPTLAPDLRTSVLFTDRPRRMGT